MSNETLSDLVQLELNLLGSDPRDRNALEALDYARRIDELPADAQPQDLIRRLDERLLALQEPFWSGAPIPAALQEVMHRRAAAIRARLPRPTPSQSRRDEHRPAGLTADDIRGAYGDATRGDPGIVL